MTVNASGGAPEGAPTGSDRPRSNVVGKVVIVLLFLLIAGAMATIAVVKRGARQAPAPTPVELAPAPAVSQGP